MKNDMHVLIKGCRRVPNCLKFQLLYIFLKSDLAQKILSFHIHFFFLFSKCGGNKLKVVIGDEVTATFTEINCEPISQVKTL